MFALVNVFLAVIDMELWLHNGNVCVRRGGTTLVVLSPTNARRLYRRFHVFTR